MKNKSTLAARVQFLIFQCLISLFIIDRAQGQKKEELVFFPANHPYIQYTGRMDYSDRAFPKGWMPGVYMRAKFTGTSCSVLIQDEMRYGNFHNYIEIAVDNNRPMRMRLTGKQNEIKVAKGLSAGDHTLLIGKNTEAGIGYLVFSGLKCKALKPLGARPNRRMEFFGNSITCGTGSDQSVIPCGQGVWQDQHNAFMSYGPIVARNLNAEYHLSAVSGIGLMHSCCNLKIVMPQVYDKINMRDDSLVWDFEKYVPQVVTICLGQNDGEQDSAAFCNHYLAFIKQLRYHYPKAVIICLTSPMADNSLSVFMKKVLTSIAQYSRAKGDRQVFAFSFSRQFSSGCDGHPDLAEHQLIARELTSYIKKLLSW